MEQLELALEGLLVAVAEAEDAPLDEDEADAPSSAASEPVENKPPAVARVSRTRPPRVSAASLIPVPRAPPIAAVICGSLVRMSANCLI